MNIRTNEAITQDKLETAYNRFGRLRKITTYQLVASLAVLLIPVGINLVSGKFIISTPLALSLIGMTLSDIFIIKTLNDFQNYLYFFNSRKTFQNSKNHIAQTKDLINLTKSVKYLLGFLPILGLVILTYDTKDFGNLLKEISRKKQS